ncbi:MAG: FAD-dependent oxidoreductase, partial [Pseudomonadota bacterium]
QDRLFKNPKVEVLWNHEVVEVVGGDNPRGVEGIHAKHVDTGEITEVACKGFFVAIGHAPATELVKDQLEMHNGGYVKVQAGTTKTSIPGVFAAGDLTDHVYRQAVTSAGMGCMAALDAEKFLAEMEGEEPADAGAFAAPVDAAE